MAATAESMSSNFSTKSCGHCGAKEMQRKPRTFRHKLFGVYPYVCLRCATHENKARFNLANIIRLVVLLVAIGSGVLAWQFGPRLIHKTDEAPQGAAEALAQARTSAGGLSAFEQMMIKKPRATMDNATILKLWKANVGPNVILQMIRTSNADYDVSATSIIELKQSGVDQTIILAMIDASYNNR
ncbi:MAG: hypothetical protein M3N93_12380 [Acidobacteriota bacterium]|nr:hypothetical protein [Acidobacteriota bacterium]